MTIAIKGSVPAAGLSAYHHQEVDGKPGFVLGLYGQPGLFVEDAEAMRLARYIEAHVIAEAVGA